MYCVNVPYSLCAVPAPSRSSWLQKLHIYGAAGAGLNPMLVLGSNECGVQVILNTRSANSLPFNSRKKEPHTAYYIQNNDMGQTVSFQVRQVNRNQIGNANVSNLNQFNIIDD